ncbi:MAG: hypothetical protein D4R67_02440, partial [Bacteroidetes bacterium]
MKKFPLHWQILVALILGILFGAFLSDYTNYVDWMGDLFLRALKMIIIPLIMSSIISGVANIGSAENLGRLGLKTLLYYAVSYPHPQLPTNREGAFSTCARALTKTR